MCTLDPNAGGPREGVCREGVFLEELGHTVSIVTLDDPESSFLQDVPVAVIALGPSVGAYRYNAKLVPWLRNHAPEYDAVVVNGLWQYQSLGTWRALSEMGTPHYIVVHGMLDPWFKHEYPLKHLKKWPYWPWADYRVLCDAKAVLFTSEEERRQAKKSFWLYRATGRVVAYGTSPPPDDSIGLSATFIAAHPELQGCRFFLFLSRIHEKKGCDLVLQAFAKVSGSNPKLHLVMAGPGSPALVKRLKRLAEERGIADRVSWPGRLQGEMKWGAFYSAEAFVLPSHQENFGIAVVEALGCGLPVLISDKVNIWREIVSDNAGLAETDTQLGTDRLLSRWLELPRQSRVDIGTNATRSYQARFRVEAMARSLLEVVGAESRAEAGVVSRAGVRS